MDFLKRFFKLKEDEVWGCLSREIDAEYVKGGFWGRDKVVATVKNWAITFEKHTVSDQYDSYTYTSVRAACASKDGFQFKIYRRGVFSKLCVFLGVQDAFNKPFNKLGKYLGMQVYMKVRPPEFERDFIVKSNNEFKVRALFANSIIRQLIQSQPDISLQLSRSELFFSSDTFIDDVARLKSLYDLFKKILNSLSDIESTYKTDLPSAEYNVRNGTADDAHSTSSYTTISPRDLPPTDAPTSVGGGADGTSEGYHEVHGGGSYGGMVLGWIG